MDQLKGTRASVRIQLQALAAAAEGSGRSRARDGLEFALVLAMIGGALSLGITALDIILLGSALTIGTVNALRGKKAKQRYDIHLLRAVLGLVAGHASSPSDDERECEVRLFSLPDNPRNSAGSPPREWKGEKRERRYESVYASVKGTSGSRAWSGALLRKGTILEKIKVLHTGERCWVRRFEYIDILTLESDTSGPLHFDSGTATFDLEGYSETRWIDESKLFTTHQVAQNLQQFLSAP